MENCLQNRFHNGISFVHCPLTLFKVTFSTWVLNSGNDSRLEVILLKSLSQPAEIQW